MHAVLSQTWTVIVASVAVIGSVGWLGYRLGVFISSSRISRRLQHDRQFGIAILEELGQRWGVKIEHQETPGGP